jgi:putative sterol carrier protein
MSDSSNPATYFEQIVPQQFNAAMQDAPDNVADQPELTVTYTIEGDDGGPYGLRINGKTIEYVPGGIAGSDMHTIQSLETWRKTVEENAMDAAIDYVLRRKIGVIKSLKGTVRLELTRSDGSTMESSTVFAGQDEPAVTMMMTTDDYRDMLSGKLNGQLAFMTGKLKFEGSLPLLMQIGGLSG